jgi:bacillithiol biosynthesis cysteine-adding enzyme BshC
VIFDPQSGGLKELLKPLFAKEILHHQDHALKVVTVSAKLEEVYHAQVKARTVNLFYHYNDARYAIEPDDDDGFRLRRKKMRFSKEELLALIEKHPAKFSPNVLLRPVCQDYLLPTGFYIAGPAETCYFAQAMPLYDAMGVTAPVIYPRASVTLIEKHLNEALTKLKLTINDLFTKSDEMQHTALRNALGFDIESLFNETQNEIAAQLDRLTVLLATMDKTTADAGQRYKVKLISALLEYKGKALQSELRKQSAVTGQLNKIRGSVFPGEKLQERVFNLFFFANKFGLSVVDRIFEQIQPGLFEHQIIEIG